MKNAASYVDGLTLHYYTFPFDDWKHKGSATGFTEKDYYVTLKKIFKMEELITKHSAIMDKYDPDKRITLMVDEWGTWYDVEQVTNPGFLYQQNTMWDAMVAGINLNIFNEHSDRVRMANIGQLVNVSQVVILTEGEKMILTPTYHVFEMFSDHQENVLIDSYITSAEVGIEEIHINDVVESASMNNQGDVVMTICNLDLSSAKQIETELIDFNYSKIEAEVLTNVKDAHNTFETPEIVTKEVFEGVRATEVGFIAVIPPCSVVKIIARV